MSRFSELGLSQPMVDTIAKIGYETPTEIQQQAIPLLLNTDTDLVGLAQTGTGKTAAFGLPLIERVDASNGYTQGLVLAPTRELCLQITKELNLFSAHAHHLRICAVYGGVDIVRQMREVKRGAHIIVATPGRLRDLMGRRAVDISHINYVVLDEADEMLNMGFKEEIDEILRDTPAEKKTWLFSATMPNEVRRIAQSYMTNPVELSVGERNASNTDIEHQFVTVRPAERYEALRRFLDYDPSIFGLVFTRTRMDAQELAEMLSRDGYNADAIHGDLSQAQRDRVMERFRSRTLRLLIATDVAARGIDVQDITHVFHYNIPDDLAFYTHRSGRTGRAGSKGISIVLMHPKDRHQLRRLENIIKARFEEIRIPSGAEICEIRIQDRMRRLREAQPLPELEAFMPVIMEELAPLSKEELAKKIAAVALNGVIKNYRGALDMNQASRQKTKQPMPDMHVARRRVFVNIGEMDIPSTKALLDMLCDKGGVPASAITGMDMNKRHTYFYAEEGASKKLIQVFNSLTIDGRAIRMNLDLERDHGPAKPNERKAKKAANRLSYPDRKPTKPKKAGAWKR